MAFGDFGTGATNGNPYSDPAGAGGGTNYSLGGIVASTVADNAARAVYNLALAQGVGENAAVAKAAEAWKEKYDAAVLTGYYDDKPTLARQTFEAGATGMYNGSPTAAYQQELADITGKFNGQDTLAAQQEQNKTTLGLLGILANLNKPANAFQYSRVLNGTPQGLRDIVDAASGRLSISGFGGGATPNYTGQGSASGPAAPAAGGASIAPGGAVNMGQATLGTLTSDIANPANAAPPSTADLPLPGQIDPRAFARFSPTQKDLFMADYQDKGWDPRDVEAQRQAALPGYRGAQRSAVGGLFAA